MLNASLINSGCESEFDQYLCAVGKEEGGSYIYIYIFIEERRLGEELEDRGKE